MKRIDLFYLGANLGAKSGDFPYDVWLDGFDPFVNNDVVTEEKIYTVKRDNATFDFDLPIVMNGILKSLNHKDILESSPSFWTVISRRFCSVLRAPPFDSVLQDFIPVRIYDNVLVKKSGQMMLSNRFSDEYALLYLRESLKIFDYHRSEYRATLLDGDGSAYTIRSEEARENEIRELYNANHTVRPSTIVLNGNELDLPAIFRLNGTGTRIYVTIKGAKAFAEAGLRNVTLFEVDKPVYITG